VTLDMVIYPLPSRRTAKALKILSAQTAKERNRVNFIHAL
jgi:hypothetical protein